jgi:hypothetical protein
MSKPEHKFRIPPVSRIRIFEGIKLFFNIQIRSIREFVGGNEWSRPTFNPSEFGELQKQVVENLIYYQSNYGAITIPFLLLVA